MRIKDLQKYMKEKKIDFSIFYNLNPLNYDRNLFYFSQYEGIGALVIPKIKKPFLIVPRMEYAKAKKGKIKVFSLDKKSRFFEFLGKKVGRCKTIGIDKNICTLNQYKYLKKTFKKRKFVDVTKICFDLRKIKTNEEIKLVKKACNIADYVLQKCIKNFKKFKTESDVVAYLENETKKQGCVTSFPPIVASGKNSGEPHHIPDKSKIVKGFCLIDFGVRYSGYGSDISRTIYVGKPSIKEKKLYDLLLNIQKGAIKNVKIKCGKLDEYVKKSLGKYKDNFTHGLGHGIGVNIHELPNLTEFSKDKFEDNMVFTIEPGIYFSKYGIRIEDDLLLKKGKLEVLTKTKKELITI